MVRDGVTAIALAVVCIAACARNPATGQLELSLVDEREEIALAREADLELREALSLYKDSEELAATVERVGARIALRTERPKLPWTFRIIDDPSVNAFALPGGFVFVTRGMLVHLNAEDELAAVLAHEAGHVAAKHGVAQLRRAADAGRATGEFSLIEPTLTGGGAWATRAGLLRALRHSRAQEDMADTLGLRYLDRAGYAGGALSEVFGVLAGLADAEGANRGVLSTHPDPRARRARIAEVTGVVERDQPQSEYMSLLEGVLFGSDPQHGFLRNNAFVYPARRFQLTMPENWTTQLGRGAVLAKSPDGDALLAVGASEANSAREAMARFFARGVRREEGAKIKAGNFRIETAAFSVELSNREFRGQVAFFQAKGQLFASIAIGGAQSWSEHAETFATHLRSLKPAAAADRAVKPMRIAVAHIAQETTLADFNERNPSSIPLRALARLNHVKPDEILEAGRPVKRVVGFNPDFAVRPQRRKG